MTQPNSLNIAIRILPFAFLIHNLEEALAMEAWISNGPIDIPSSVSLPGFVFAVAVISALGFALVFAKRLYKNERQFLLFVSGFAGMLFLNVFLPHLMGAIAFQRYVPGVITAVTVNLPLTVFILNQIRTSGKITPKSLLIAIAVGGMTGIILVFALLSLPAFL